MKRYPTFTACCVLAVLAAGCGMKQEKATAEAVATNLFAKVQLGDFDSAMSLYSPKFFEQTSKDEWKSLLGNLQKKLGSLESYELVTWNFKKQAHTSGSGTYWVLQYKVTYSKYPATETVTVFKPVGGTFQILGHNINSTGLLKE